VKAATGAKGQALWKPCASRSPADRRPELAPLLGHARPHPRRLNRFAA
jgi:hypothetical protein